MLFNYNINNCGWNNFLDPDWSNITSYKLELPKAKYINLNYRDELHKAVSKLPEDNYAILYSGGIDSAIVMQTFYNCNKTFTPFVAEFWLNGKLLNEYELSFVNDDCTRCNATPVRIELDVKQILTKELDRLCNIFPTRGPERVVQLVILEHIPKKYKVVTGEGDPNISYEDNTLYWVDRSIALHMKMYSEYLGLGECIWGLGFTPELYHPLTQDVILNDWFVKLKNFNHVEQQWAYTGKMNFYNFYFPEISKRNKIIACDRESIIEPQLPGVWKWYTNNEQKYNFKIK
tara:strand:- start:46 stop:912 length:867 start_codon:yes stop_codon:yes gene_type:complete